jgi:hypothetical protein
MRPVVRLRRATHPLTVLVLVAASAGIATVTPNATVAAMDNTPWTTPTKPPLCTEAQADSGLVSTCLLYGGYNRPDEKGWPSPPFPETVAGQPFPPGGWVWLGHTYNGSPALAGWERQMKSNSSAIGGIGAGRLTLLPEAQLLFDGFLREVHANGYRVREGGGYTFRCTSSSTRNCYGVTRERLSYHAYGLAIDFNSATNPIRTYYGVNGASACSTPMATDMPRWVVQTAEKWGLYWGGYGWSSGCSSPSESRSSVFRDPTHFEFRGSRQQARAVLRANGRGPTNCVASVTAAGGATQTCMFADEVTPAGTRLLVDTDAPAGATAALVNITVVGATGNGAVTAESCGPASTRPTMNNMVSTGRTLGNVSMVPIDTSGRFCLYQSMGAHTVVDLQGFFVPASSAANGLAFTPSTGERVLNTRTQPFCRPDGTCTTGMVPAGTEVQIEVPGAPPATVATFANLVMTEPSGRGYLTADRCDLLVPGPQKTSSLNTMPGVVASNLGVVGSQLTGTTSQLCTTASISGHLIVDVQGFFAPATNGGLTVGQVAPSRVFSRNVTAGSVTRMTAPAGAAAVVVNLSTSSAPSSGGYVTGAPCADLVPGPQATANSNFGVGTRSSNLAVVPVDSNGEVCFYTSAAVTLTVDLQATFVDGDGLRYLMATPTRLLDTR